MLEFEENLDKTLVPLWGKLAEFQDFLDQGIIYGHGRDNQNRPVLIYNVRKALDLGFDMDKFLDVLEFIFNYTLEHAMIPGKIETLNYIVDVKDVPVWDFPVADLAKMAKRTKKSFKLRLNQLTITNCHWMLKTAAQIITTFVDERIMGKIAFFSNNGEKHLTSFISRDRLEQKYGGNRPDITADFFPPHFNL